MPFFGRKSGNKQAASSPKSKPRGLSWLSSATSRDSSQEASSPDLPNGTLESPLEGSGSVGGPGQPKVLLLATEDQSSNASIPQMSMPGSSRLSKSLEEIIHDKDALPYLLQYLNYRKNGHLLQFWLDTQSFQAATLMRLQSSRARRQSDGRCSLEDIQSSCSYTSDCSVRTLDNNSRLNGQEDRTCANDHHGDISASATPSRIESLSLPQSACDSSDTECLSSIQDHSDHIKSNNESDSIATASASPSIPCQDSSTRKASTSSSSSLSTASHTLSHLSNMAAATAGCDGCAAVSKSQGETSQHLSVQDRLKQSIEQDAVNIFSRYISKDCPQPIEVSDVLRDEVVRGICREDGEVDPHCFVPCQDHVMRRIHNEYFTDFIQSEFHCQHQVDLLTSTQVNLADVLFNDSAMFYFMEYMEQEGALSLLQCWQELESFSQLLSSQEGNYDAVQAQTDAMVLYDKYFSLQATKPLGFSDKVRFEVEGNICREEGPLPDCFNLPKLTVLQTMHKVYFPPFLKSQIFFKFLSDLINTVTTAQDVPQFRKSRRGSDDASSEHSVGSQSTGSENVSISSRNTLLAGAQDPTAPSSSVKKAIYHIEDDMRIDNMLFNPDALWERPQAGKMSLGRINELGHFVSELAPQPDQEKKKKGRLVETGPFFKRNKNKESQEEMAFKIAQMIVSDITSITQNEEGSDDES